MTQGRVIRTSAVVSAGSVEPFVPISGTGEPLSPREEQILGLATSGLIDKEISRQLGISPNTLRTYWRRIRSKMGDHIRSALVADFVGQGAAKLGAAHPTVNSEGAASLLIYLSSELTRARQAERHSRRALTVLECLIDPLLGLQGEVAIYASLCKVLVEVGGYVMAFVARPNATPGETIEILASAGDSTGYLAEAQIKSDQSPRGLGPFGRAVLSGQMQVNRDFLVDPVTAPWHDLAAIAGLHASTCIPLALGDTRPTIVTCYAPEADAFESQELRLLVNIVGLVSRRVIVVRAKADRSLAEPIIT